MRPLGCCNTSLPMNTFPLKGDQDSDLNCVLRAVTHLFWVSLLSPLSPRLLL